MKLEAIETWHVRVPLSRPYVIAYESIDAVELLFVRVRSGKHAGLGCASPLPEVTGESFAACAAALKGPRLEGLRGRELDLPVLLAGLAVSHAHTPAARAALDMALHDLQARQAGIPLVELLGRAHDSMPTSITIGIKTTAAEVIAEAKEYVARGFTCIKLKTGHDLAEDLARVRLLRERFGQSIRLRLDANTGCKSTELAPLFAAAEAYDLELVEQPRPRTADAELAELPTTARRKLALDESLLDERDAERLAGAANPCGIFNIKLMKCGGIAPALAMAKIAQHADIALMWGCNDESRIGIAAALHAGLACPATRFLDLDGHLDLARDPARGGFTITAGVMRTLDAPGLGVELGDGD